MCNLTLMQKASSLTRIVIECVCLFVVSKAGDEDGLSLKAATPCAVQMMVYLVKW